MLKLIFILVLLKGNLANVRTWIRNLDAMSPTNWIQTTSDCQEFEFPEEVPLMLIGTISTQKLKFPKTGLLVMRDNETITFDETDKKCIKVKETGVVYWNDPKNWNSLANKAIPDFYRLPCKNDDVVFPNGSWTDRIIKPRYGFTHNSITINERKFVTENVAGCQTREECCGGKYTNAFIDATCEFHKALLRKEIKLGCEDPIEVIGQCTPICGASIIFQSDNPKRQLLDEFLSGYTEVDFFVSKLYQYYLPKGSYQIVLVDKTDSSMESARVAEILKEILSRENDFNARLSQIEYSKIAKDRGHVVATAFGTIFGALFATLVFFAVVWFVYEGPLRNKRLFPKGTRNVRPYVFARFRNHEDGDLTLERSVTSSTISLEKSFDNPLYGLATTSNQSDATELNVDETNSGAAIRGNLIEELEIQEI